MEESHESKHQEKSSHKTKVEKPKGPGIFSRFKGKLSQYKRVVSIARKPEKEEFVSSVKITGTGILLVGAIGFIIFLLYFLVRSL